VDDYGAAAVLILAIVFTIALSWVYGTMRLGRDIKAMLGDVVSLYWKVLWKVVTPLLILVSWWTNLAKLDTFFGIKMVFVTLELV